MLSERLNRLRKELDSLDLEALLITDNLNIRYVSGFAGTFSVLLVTCNRACMLTDTRYAEYAEVECPAWDLHIIDRDWIASAANLIKSQNLQRIGFENHSLTYQSWTQLCSLLQDEDIEPTNFIINKLRMIKDESEIDLTRKAAKIADEAFEHILSIIKPGLTEREVALELDYFMRSHGADKEAFDSIVASGPRSALPHGQPTDRRISENELILFDFGAKYGGYHSDITRTIVLGALDPKQEDIYNTVMEAQSKALNAIKPGIFGWEVDSLARNYITKKGYGDCFGHGLGHGLGLDIHDGRLLARGSEIRLEPGMVMTVEPGIYIPGWGGVRIEDDVLVTQDSCEILTAAPKSLLY